jgi:hypothetical protein
MIFSIEVGRENYTETTLTSTMIEGMIGESAIAKDFMCRPSSMARIAAKILCWITARATAKESSLFPIYFT